MERPKKVQNAIPLAQNRIGPVFIPYAGATNMK
jgi:hypothetical protein